MNAQLTLLAVRRARLVAEATEQRRALVDELLRWQAPLESVERGLVRLAWARKHLYWVIAAGIAIVASPKVRGWVILGTQLWRAVRRLRAQQGR